MENTAETQTHVPLPRQAERRTTHRLISVRCRKRAARKNENLSTVVIDVSTTGICFFLNEPLDSQTEMEVAFTGYPFVGPLQRTGKVCWQFVVAPGHFATGIEFDQAIPHCDWKKLVEMN